MIIILRMIYRNPIGDFPFYVLIETSGSNETHDMEKLTKFFEETMESGLVLDGTLCSEPSRIKVTIIIIFILYMKAMRI